MLFCKERVWQLLELEYWPTRRLANAGKSRLYLLNLSSFEVTHMYLSISVLCFTLLFFFFTFQQLKSLVNLQITMFFFYVTYKTHNQRVKTDALSQIKVVYERVYEYY